MAVPAEKFADVLRGLRGRARLTQQELADAAGVSLRTVSDLERGAATSPQRETVRLLADALALIGPERAGFETAARGRPLAAAPQEAEAAALRSLPRDVVSFTGRGRELEQLVKSAVTAGGVVGIHAIGGMAGVGKTAFAVHAAHQLAGQFPGGQVFLALHGHTPGQAPADPGDALASLLLAVGVAAARIPPGVAARAALWRDQVAGRRLLLVLDDAVSSEQVRPLLPGSGASLVLVTSRRHLSALDDATAISLDTLPPGEAAALLVRLAGRAGLSAGDRGVREITGLCGCLPLAVGMVARQLRHHPAWSAAGRARELASARDRLGLLETENVSVAAAFDLSYAELGEDQRRLFRRLGLHPGADIDGYAAAALGGVSVAAARRGLEGLYDLYLLTEPAQGRYRLHDLIREHARVLAARVDPAPDRDAATARLLDYYQHTAATANQRIRGRIRPGQAVAAGGPEVRGAAPAVSGAAPDAVPVLADQEKALAWLRAERASLFACLDEAVAAGQLARVIALTASIGGLLQYDGPWTDAVTRHAAAVAAARQVGDRLALANALTELGDARTVTDDYPIAAQAYTQALDIYRELGERFGQARVLAGLGDIWYVTGDYPAAVRDHEQALELYRGLDDQSGQAEILNQLGTVRRLMCDYPASVRAKEQALVMYQDLGDRLGQAKALNGLGSVLQITGDYQGALRVKQEALGIYRELGARRGEAGALSSLGGVLQLAGDYPAAVRAMEQALAIHRDLGIRLGQANSLSRLGGVLRLTGDYPAAALALDEALAIFRDIGERGGTAVALNERGALHRVSGELTLAQDRHQESLDLSREIGSFWDEAHALAGLGRCALAAGQAGQAGTLLRQALEIFGQIGAAEAADLSAELDALPPAE